MACAGGQGEMEEQVLERVERRQAEPMVVQADVAPEVKDLVARRRAGPG